MDDFENATTASSDNNETIQAVAMCVIASVGLILNVIVCIMIIVLGEYKKTSHWYVLNLAVADGVFLLLLPLAAMEKIAGEWKLGEGFCIVYTGAFYMNYYASIFFLTVMSFDRYVAIVFPMSATWRKLRSRLGSGIITIFVWILALAVSLPLLLHTKLIDLDDFDKSLNNETAYKCGLDFHDANNVEHKCIKLGLPVEGCEDRLSELGLYGIDDLTRYMNLSSKPSSIGPETPTILENPILIEDDEFMLFDEQVESSSYQPNSDDYDSFGFSGFDNSNNTRVIDEAYCHHEPYPIHVGWIYANIVVAYILPLSIIAFCYGCILWRILHPKIKTAQASLQKERRKSFLKRRFSSTSSQQKRTYRATVLVVSLVAAFLLCWTPFEIINVLKLKRISDDPYICRVSVKIANFVAYSSSLLNPLLYTFLGANFGKRFTRVWNKIRGRRQDRPVFRRASRSNGRASMMSKSTKSLTDSTNFHHINMQLLPPMHKREPSMS